MFYSPWTKIYLHLLTFGFCLHVFILSPFLGAVLRRAFSLRMLILFRTFRKEPDSIFPPVFSLNAKLRLPERHLCQLWPPEVFIKLVSISASHWFWNILQRRDNSYILKMTKVNEVGSYRLLRLITSSSSVKQTQAVCSNVVMRCIFLSRLSLVDRLFWESSFTPGNDYLGSVFPK